MFKRFFSLSLLGAGCVSLLPLNSNAQTVTAPQGSFSFPSANVCPAGQNGPTPCSQNAPISFNVTAGGILGTPRVVTDGIPHLDFTLGSGSTCSGAVSTSSCNVNVTFAPRYPGMRRGAVQIVNALPRRSTQNPGEPGTLHRDYCFTFTPAPTPLTVPLLGRLCVPGTLAANTTYF